MKNELELDFKTWLEDLGKYPGTRNQSLPPPGKRYAGWRDIRFGYGLHHGNQPLLPARIGSDVISGMGNVFRKRMGVGFPMYGSGYHSFFDGLTQSFEDGKDFLVVRTEPYDEKDDPKGDKLKELTDNALEKVRKMTDVAQAAEKTGSDMSLDPSTTYEPHEKEGYIKIIFRFKPKQRLTDRLRLTTAAAQGPEEEEEEE